MSAGEVPMIKQIEDHKKTWRELWLNMAGGDVIKYKEIKKLDVLTEFWPYFDFWRQQQTKKLENLRKQNSKNER